ncbi:GNAT family N-acetyltransferase [uncultured Tateyamaria sp.]|uniref:GNAT family N-acetyltransferase n=1 Tax=Tateyamaria sp. 1078 TaxID=3417464 RepID=UPI0026208DF4|nr:GNAT family N-acetyltransferase [uncultured Tateyamaria sp.]
MIRAFFAADTDAAIRLYRHLVGDQPLAAPETFAAVIAHPGTTVLGDWDGAFARAMATLHILPNMTQGGRPYALIENVVTDADHRGAGHGRRVMEAAVQAAWGTDCYKIMLLTGQTAEARGFYEALGFSADEKWGMTLRRAPLRRP